MATVTKFVGTDAFSTSTFNNKIDEILDLFGLKDHILVTGDEIFDDDIDYEKVHSRIAKARENSIAFLK